MILLLRYWPYIIGAIALAGIIFTVLSWRADSIRLDKCEADYSDALEAITDMQAQADKEREQANEYHTNLNSVQRELDRVKRVRPSRCICPAQAARACDAPASADNQLHQSHGVTTDSLYDFAADAERVRLQLDACQSWAGGV